MTDWEVWVDSTHHTTPKTTLATWEADLAARAFLLARLGFTKKRAEARLRQNIAWEFDRLGKPAVKKRVAALVTDAFRRAGVTKTKKK